MVKKKTVPSLDKQIPTTDLSFCSSGWRWYFSLFFHYNFCSYSFLELILSVFLASQLMYCNCLRSQYFSKSQSRKPRTSMCSTTDADGRGEPRPCPAAPQGPAPVRAARLCVPAFSSRLSSAAALYPSSPLELPQSRSGRATWATHTARWRRSRRPSLWTGRQRTRAPQWPLLRPRQPGSCHTPSAASTAAGPGAPLTSQTHSVTEPLRMENTFESLRPNVKPAPPLSSPCPRVPHPRVFWTLSGMRTPPLLSLFKRSATPSGLLVCCFFFP